MNKVELHKVCKINNGYAFRSEDYLNNGVPLLRISNFDDGEVVVNEKSIYLKEEFLDTKSDFIVEKGDILIALSGATTGKYGIYNYNFPSLLNQRIGLIKSSSSDKLNSKYFYHYLTILKGEILRNAGGAAQPNISTKTIGGLQIPLPPLPQQQKIANILDAADALRQKDKALLAKYDELTQALFLDMFGDPVSNPKGWEKVELKKICSIKKKNIKPEDITAGENYVALDSVEKVTGNITTIYNVEKGELKSNKFWFDNSYILYGKLRPYLNKVALPEFEGVCSTDIIPIQPIKNRSNRLFITSILRHKSFVSFADERSSGANLPRISPTQVEKYLTINPPLIIQNQFAARVQVIEHQKAVAQKSLEKSEELFNSLLQKAFKGELL
ncbi:type I restriction enzyme, S subunit [Flavobacterium micromati]|uniref:Type I restriction enzyme, S subunit n=1 Tax=Flavobacterium micromati TaxID=229205 RepID=A0A1M5Q2U7_9FLAO|nr:restriction endonuclease subunit S [Flavobacterium micromati]SHH08091.1 type I restriction enzyme, S subunit [Flavobacterium micromati]